MSRRVRPEVVRRRLVALLEPSTWPSELVSEHESEWQAGFAAGLRAAQAVIRKG